MVQYLPTGDDPGMIIGQDLYEARKGTPNAFLENIRYAIGDCPVCDAPNHTCTGHDFPMVDPDSIVM